MTQPSQEIPIPTATPEQLLQALERELALGRAKRRLRPRRRIEVLVGGVLIILLALGGALLVGEKMVADLRESGALPKAAPVKSAANL